MAKVTGIIVVTLVSFSLFFYWLFPYEVAKEAFAAKISEVTGLRVEIGDLDPDLPLGATFGKVRVSLDDGSSIVFNEVSASVSFLNFFIGRLKVNAELVDVKGGTCEVGVAFKFTDLVRRHIFPAVVEMDAEQFGFADVINFVLTKQVASMQGNMASLVGPVVEQIRLAGDLGGTVDLVFDTNDMRKSTGDIDVQFENFVLSSPIMPDQNFKKSALDVRLKEGRMIFGKKSQFSSELVDVAFDGNIMLAADLVHSQLTLEVPISLRGDLLGQLESLFYYAFRRGLQNGKGTLKVSGSLSKPEVELL